MTTATKKESTAATTNVVDSTEHRNVPVQHVRDIALEERLDKLILLIEAQNKAWQKSLTLLTEINTLMLEKYKSADILLEEHPPVRNSIRERTAATGAPQPQPFNNYSDSLPYGTDLEEEREAPPESFPPRAQTDIPDRPTALRMSAAEYTQGESPPGYGDEPHGNYNDDPVSESAAPNSAEPAPQEPRMRVAPGPPVSSKAELLERVEKVS